MDIALYDGTLAEAYLKVFSFAALTCSFSKTSQLVKETPTRAFSIKLSLLTLSPLEGVKSKLDNFSKSTNWVKSLKKKPSKHQHHSKVLLNSFPMNGHTLGFCTWSQKLENFVSPKV